MKRLTDNEVDYNLTTLKGWELDENESRIIKCFEFKNFKEAIATMVKIGEVAEELGHHPDWYNSYNKLNIKLSTHDVGGLTMKDFELAQRIEEITNIQKPKRKRI
ncbi:MAG: 4a-hydroxytetrahydrobiopterin dehydratase [Flavobacteriales bacterium]|nr:4a-hydroxytetrahydrobiopterin dehydratase [Flavobacteriales bacterium]